MRSILLDARRRLRAADVPSPVPGPGDVRVAVKACGVCRTDLHIAEGNLAAPRLPLVLGHQAVGVVEEAGEAVDRLAPGSRVGVPWLGWTCGTCRYCASGRENLCPHARFTGFDRDGGFAEELIADARFCFEIPPGYPDVQAAPLLCAGLIGYRCLRAAGDAERLGVFGFGNAAHILTQVARHLGRRVFAFTRPGDEAGQASAREVGAEWAGGTDERPPEELDAAIVFAAAGELVPTALAATAPGGTVVCGEIHMTDVPSFPYELLWRERSLRSVANLTRRDGEEFLALAPRVPVRTRVEPVSLDDAPSALERLRRAEVRGALVVVPGAPAPSMSPS